MARSMQAVETAKAITHWVDGKPFTGHPVGHGDVYDPATGEVSGRVGFAGPADVDAAVEAALRAFTEWSQAPVLRRARVMFRLKELVERHHDELAGIVSSEHGKVISDAKGSVQRGLENLEFACGIPQLLKGEYNEQVGTGVDCYSVRQPLGVCVGITPFNFPAMVPLWMFPLAIACGNTFVLKPSEKDPSCSLRLAELVAEAGVPPGVLNVVHGDRIAVDALLEHPKVSAVSFVGSTPVAEHVYRTATSTGKRVQALGGAKNHMVVLPDADMDQAADALVASGYGSAGERCMAISVGVLVGDAGDAMVDRLVPRIEALKIGPGSDPSSEMGPLVTAEHRERVRSYIELGLEEGAELIVDGRNCQIPGHEEGFFLGPCLFDRAEAGMRIYQEEIFGPVLTIVRVDSFDEAVGLVNAHEYGNGTAVFTRDGDAAREFARDIQVGMVGINVPIPVPLAFHSFGGWKHSIFGDVAMYGPEGARFYTRLKTITSRWPTGIREGVDLNMPVIK